MTFKLLTRTAFREGTLARDHHTCVWCGTKEGPFDAHHIFERRLWPDEGYYLENGATLCSPCHRLAESTEVSTEELHAKIGAVRYPVPPSFVLGEPYDKWGNPILANGTRTKGPLFQGHEKVLGPVLHLFVGKVKYPRTFHLPWSPGMTSDDRRIENLDAFIGQRVIVTEKMDGENTTLSRDYVHARSVEGYTPHSSRNHMKVLHAKVGYDIPEGWRICGENLWGVHSIRYKELTSLFQVFSVWNDQNVCLSWEETLEWCSLLGLEHVPVLYAGPWEGFDRKPEKRTSDEVEGYVIRVAGSFDYREFNRKVAKYVRSNHVTSNTHWKSGLVEPNELKGGS